MSKGANERTWQKVSYRILPSGQTVPEIHRYKELTTGLNFWDSTTGQWAESSEEIDILPDGTAAATHLQSPVYFPGDIASGIRLVTPEGEQLQNGPAFLEFDDGTNIALIGVTTNSAGQLISSNQVLYPDIFQGSGFHADLLCTVRKSGIESDLVFREQIPDPTSLGLGANARLQLLTEWFGAPEPVQTISAPSTSDGLTDTTLRFGSMTFGRGKAFVIGTDAQSSDQTPVYKSWLHVNGRKFLMEEVPYDLMAPQMEQLPMPESTAMSMNSAHSALRKVSATRLLPPSRVAQASTNGIQLAKAGFGRQRGVVLDYVTINSSLTNYVFQADNTYLISGSLNSFGVNNFEGGTVIKFSTNGSIAITPGPTGAPSINWKAGAYRPVIFTAKDDNTVGESIGTGSPTGYYGSPMLLLGSFSPSAPMTGLRMSYAKTAIFFGGANANIYDAQFINCQNGLNLGGATVFLGNALFANVGTEFVYQGGSALNAQNTTFSGSFLLAVASSSPNGNSLALTNCILANVTNLVSGLLVSTNGNYNGFYNCPPLGIGRSTNTFYPFQAVGAGNYYLTNGCNFSNQGTNNIDSTLLADLQKKTTHPPILYSNLTITTNLTLSPQVWRDTNAAPDLGYHYDPIDYIVDKLAITNATLTLTNGVAIASYNEAGVRLQDGSAIVSIGSPLCPNWFVRFSSVQEKPVFLGGTNNAGGMDVTPFYSSATPSGQFQFTKFACPAGGGIHLYDYNTSSYSNLMIQECEFWGGSAVLGGTNSAVMALNNNLFARSVINAAGSGSLAFSNNLVWGASSVQLNPAGGSTWYAYNNDFDSSTITNSTLTNGYNAYLNCGGYLSPTNSTDTFSINTLAYQTGWLGSFYQPTNSPLIDKGSVTADQVGLYHFTTQTNQVKETNSIVDIGYHYVAVGTNGNPIDSDGDGIPDSIADKNGNGIVDTNEIPWAYPPVILQQPTSQTVVQGANVTFSVTMSNNCTLSLSYQWYFNTNTLIVGATGATLMLTNVQTTNAGFYRVVVTNVLGSAISSNALLTVLVPPVITAQPTNQMVIQGTNVTFSVTATGTTPLGYQWYFNGINLLAGATNAALTLTNVHLSAAGNYSVVITNVAGSVTSSNAVLTIQVAVPGVAVGGERIMALTGDGDVISWGGNQYGELGDYTYLDSTDPVHVVELTNLIKIASGVNHSLAIDSTGALWAWGDNQFAQLGKGVFNKTNLPVQVSGMTNSVIAVAGGTRTSIAAKADGTVWAWGTRPEGSDYVTTVVPAQVQGLTNVVAVAAGDRHFLALSIAGTVWAWGTDDYGQLGDGMAGSSDMPIQVTVLSNIVAICAGAVHSMALDTNGCVWAWGLNDSGQLGDGGTEAANGLPVMVLSNAVQIAAGRYHSLALDTESNVWAWGNNSAGQLGTNGFNMTNLPVQVVELTNIAAIAAGSDASAALDADGNVWQWGASDDDGTNWMWSDETGSPALAPQYVDFYNGQLPNLTITNGNNQTPHAGLEFPQPLVFRVTDTNGMALSNAPVSVEVITGDMELRTVSGGDNLKRLRLTTDTNGEVSLIGYADRYFNNANCLVRVLTASRQRVVEVDFNETLIPLPTVSFTSLANGNTYLVETNQGLTITVAAEAALGSSIQEVDYYYQTNGGDMTLLGTSVESPFTFAWANAFWWTNAFVGQYTLSAVAVDNAGARSDPANVNITVALDTDGNGMPDYWQLEYFGQLDIDPNADPDGDGLSNLQEYQQGTDPTDHYNGQTPSLEILSGNDQAGNYASFLPVPVTIQVTGVSSISNAPMTFTVTNGTALLAATTNDSPDTTLSLRTDSNGLASVWIYFPSASSTPPDSTILASTYRGINLDAVTTNANEYVLLAHWRFDNTNIWIGEEGQLPLLTNNLVGVPDWSSNAVLVDSASPALLSYNVAETNGSTNINCQTGSVLFYFKPDWSSADQGGTGPGNSGRLIEMGSYSPDFTNGWWSLYLSPDGTNLMFATSTNGNGMTNLIANVSWTSNTWYQIALTYSPTGSALFIDGQMLTNGDGVAYFQNVDELTNGFRIGSDQDGNNQAAGAFDELETFASPLAGIGAPVDTYWFGIPDYKADPNGTLGAWEMLYFGHLGVDPNGDYDNNGTNNVQEFINGADPNKISFSLSFPNQYVTTNVVSGVITILGGVPSSIAILVDNTNLAGAIWTNYNSSNITVNLGSTNGIYDIWIGLRGLPASAHQTWEETTLILDSTPPTISITNPVDTATFNASRVNVSGNFTAASLHQITVNGTLAFVNGTNFEVLNVPLVAGPNTITAVIEDLTGETNVASITIIGLTNTDGSMNEPVQLQATPVAGFAPLQVTFSVQTNVPGTIQQVSYDFNGDDIADFVTNNSGPVSWTYATNGEYFPVVTIQTTTGRFSSVGGWNAVAVDPSNQPVQITVQSAPTQTTLASVTDPVDLKWDGTNLYVLSGSSGTITEFATNGSSIGTPLNIGASSSGFDVDAAGNIYVAVTSSNQVWKFIPTNSSYIADTNFGNGGFIGLTNGASGADTNEFNAPFDVAVSPDGGTISVSDSGNDRIQQFSAVDGSFSAVFGTNGTDVGEFNAPKGLTYDASGTLYIVESNRISLAQGTFVTSTTGTNGAAFGQFSNALNINFGEHGVYVADTGNNRIQSFNSAVPHNPFSTDPSVFRLAVVTNLNQPSAIAARDDDLTTETFYVADTGNNRVVLYTFASGDPTPAWISMTNHVIAGDISGALASFSIASVDDYRDLFLATGTSATISTISNIGALTPVYIDDDKAEYYFTQTINGQDIGFMVEFVKENGVWKILEF